MCVYDVHAVGDASVLRHFHYNNRIGLFAEIRGIRGRRSLHDSPLNLQNDRLPLPPPTKRRRIDPELDGKTDSAYTMSDIMHKLDWKSLSLSYQKKSWLAPTQPSLPLLWYVMTPTIEVSNKKMLGWADARHFHFPYDNYNDHNKDAAPPKTGYWICCLKRGDIVSLKFGYWILPTE